MTLVVFIAVIMGFVLGARFLKILSRAVDWLYLSDEGEEYDNSISDSFNENEGRKRKEKKEKKCS